MQHGTAPRTPGMLIVITNLQLIVPFFGICTALGTQRNEKGDAYVQVVPVAGFLVWHVPMCSWTHYKVVKDIEAFVRMQFYEITT